MRQKLASCSLLLPKQRDPVGQVAKRTSHHLTQALRYLSPPQRTTKMGTLLCRCRWSSQQLEVAAMPGGQMQMAVQQKNLGTSQKTSPTAPSQKWTMLGMWQRPRAFWFP